MKTHKKCGKSDKIRHERSWGRILNKCRELNGRRPCHPPKQAGFIYSAYIPDSSALMTNQINEQRSYLIKGGWFLSDGFISPHLRFCNKGRSHSFAMCSFDTGFSTILNKTWWPYLSSGTPNTAKIVYFSDFPNFPHPHEPYRKQPGITTGYTASHQWVVPVDIFVPASPYFI